MKLCCSAFIFLGLGSLCGSSLVLHLEEFPGFVFKLICIYKERETTETIMKVAKNFNRHPCQSWRSSSALPCSYKSMECMLLLACGKLVSCQWDAQSLAIYFFLAIICHDNVIQDKICQQMHQQALSAYTS